MKRVQLNIIHVFGLLRAPGVKVHPPEGNPLPPP